MKFKASLFISILSFLILTAFFVFPKSDDNLFVTYKVNLQKKKLKLYWKDDNNVSFKSIENLQHYLSKNHKKLIFAMNGGMYKKDNSPQGLYIENGKTLANIDTTSSSNGNFYLKPNGVFYINDKNKPFICKTELFKNKNILYATQSGPMLVVDGEIHKAFNANSTNLNIRNGVGVLPNNEVVFAMSKKEINLYDFANYFKKLGCKNALYLDGFVSRTYCPEKKWIQKDGNFGVIIGVTN